MYVSHVLKNMSFRVYFNLVEGGDVNILSSHFLGHPVYLPYLRHCPSLMSPGRGNGGSRSLQGPFSKWNDGWCSLFNNSSGWGSILLMNPKFPLLVQLSYRRHYELCRDWQHRCLGICMVYIGWQAISQYKIQIKSSDIETEFLVKPGMDTSRAFGTKIFIPLIDFKQ